MTQASSLILFFDRNNLIGQDLADALSEESMVVLVSRQVQKSDKSTVFIKLGEVFPQIPDGSYRKIVFVWEKESESFFQPLLEKAQNREIDFYVVLDYLEKENFEKKHPRMYKKEQVLIMGDLFGGKKDFPLDTFLYSLKSSKKISLSHMGLHLWYPISYTSIIEKIKQVIFDESRQGVLFLGPQHGVTALSLAHAIQKSDPSVLIDFSLRDEKLPFVMQKEPSVFKEYDPLLAVRKQYESLIVRREIREGKEAEIIFARSKGGKKIFSKAFYIFYLIFAALVLPLLCALLSAGIGTFLLGSAVSDLKKGSMDVVYQKSHTATEYFSFSIVSTVFVKNEFAFTGLGSSISFLQKKLQLEENFSILLEDGSFAFEKLSGIFSGKTFSPKEDSIAAVGALKHGLLTLQDISQDDVPKEYAKTLSSFKQLAIPIGGFIDELPQLLGTSGDKTYLILFQNNMELRPGGGFIGSYGILQLHAGKVKNFTIHDVYDADGQLQGHVEPPFAIRRYMPLVHLYLRDSNFDPDFLNNAQTAAKLLLSETGDRVDGVIGIDLNVMKSLLGGIGSVYVPSYNETVTEDNFFTLLEKHAEKNFFSGSTQKKDFLRAFFDVVLGKFQKKAMSSSEVFIEQSMGLLEGKHILFAFSDPLLQAPFSLNNLSGSLKEYASTSSGNFSDFLGITEANLGVNKVNAFVTRKLSQQILIDEKGVVSERVTLILANSSDGSWPGGVYKNFIRFILPDNAVLSSISLNDVEQHIVGAITDPKIYEAKSFTPPSGLEMTTDKESGKMLYGFLFTVPEKSSRKITIQYTLNGNLSLSSLQNYSLKVWKQPGVDAYPYDLLVTYPQALQVITTNLQQSAAQTLSYTDSVSGDIVVRASFSSK